VSSCLIRVEFSCQGKLALDRPIADVLPELAAPQVLEGFDAAGEPKLRAAARPITLRHLITHTAGFCYDIWNPQVARYVERKEIPSIFTCQNAALMLPLAFDPGQRWEYGVNIDWIGKAVERVSGQRLGDYFAEHLFGPIGMKDTGFKLTPERPIVRDFHADLLGAVPHRLFDFVDEPAISSVAGQIQRECARRCRGALVQRVPPGPEHSSSKLSTGVSRVLR
jgi:CubicO group peptidase (beta-lactamase class C family)